MNIEQVNKTYLYTKILGCIGILFLLLLGFIVVKSQMDTIQIIDEKEKETAQMALDVVPRRFFVSRQILSASIGQMVLNERLIEVFAQRDREALTLRALSAVDLLRRSDIDIFHFHLPDNRTFFRAHQPNFYGDDLTELRPMVAEVNRTQRAAVGWEEGVSGYALRHIEPVFYQGEYVGALELGMYLEERILNIWKRAVFGEWFLCALKDGEYIRVAGTTKRDCQLTLSEEDLTALKNNQSLFFRLDHEFVQVIPLKDYTGKINFHIKRIHDNSEILGLAISQRNTSILYGLLMVGLGFLVIAFLIRFFLRPLKYLVGKARAFAAGDLERPIRVKTTDEIGLLAATMETMRQSLSASRKALEDSKELFKTISDVATDWILWQTPHGEIVYTSPACERITGYTVQDLLDNPGLVKKMVHPEDLEQWTFHFHDVKRQQDPGGNEFRIVTKQGMVKWIEHICLPVYNEKNEFVGIRSSNTDITSRKKIEAQLEYLSLRDKLTDLYNRAFLECEIERFEGGRSYPVTILAADLDGLKLANDTFGHKKGDELLTAASRLMRGCLRKEDVLARVGGDEFIALMPGADQKTGDLVAKRIQQAVEEYNSSRKDLPLGISIGAATSEGPETTIEETIRRADDLMYQNKRLRKRQSIGTPAL
jgi:diguanylate cyclase (GGDEF)-like protein/PAS domain S-box-containing protein